ncbi:MAG: hypothetical protein IT308_09570 [Anaerolineaceae bacterium]|nr:hypothetical protein [Anaerolineaceae bacterium]
MRAMMRRFDVWVSHQRGIFDFSGDERCILRGELRRAGRALHLPDIDLHANDTILKFHLWNSHLPIMPAEGADLGWAAETWHRFLFSLGVLARQLRDDPALQNIKAISGVSSLFSLKGAASGARLMKRVGFSVYPRPNPLGAPGAFLENVYSWLLVWAYNPASLKGHALPGLERTVLWMSVAELYRRFGKDGQNTY